MDATSASYVGLDPSQTGTNGSVLLQENTNVTIPERTISCLIFIAFLFKRTVKNTPYFNDAKFATVDVVVQVSKDRAFYYICYVRFRLLHNVLIIVILLVSANAYAQSNKDSAQTMKYFLLFDKYEYTDTLKAKAYADSGVISAKKSKNNTMIGKAYRYMGWYFQDRGKFKIANDHFYKSLSYLRKAGDNQGIAGNY